MPPKRAVPKPRPTYGYSSDSDDDSISGTKKPKKSAKNANRKSQPAPAPAVEDDITMFDDENDDDIYNEEQLQYKKLADEVVSKNVQLKALFDPNMIPRFSSLMNQSTKVSSASRVLEASFKVYGKRVDVCHTEVSKLREQVEFQKPSSKKKVTINTDPFNITQVEQNRHDNGFFSEEDEVQLTEKKRRQVETQNGSFVDQTVANFNFDQAGAPAHTSEFEGLFRHEDSNVRKLKMMARDRRVLLSDGSQTPESVERDLLRGNELALECFRKEFLRRAYHKQKNAGKKEAATENERRTNQKSFHVPYYQYAMDKKREKRHVSFDDVAACSSDLSRIYIHNEWMEEDPNKKHYFGSFVDYSGITQKRGVDVNDAILEHFQGTFELVTATHEKIEPEWIKMFGLEKRDLKLIADDDDDVPFEETANEDYDPDNRLVDRLSFPEEDAVMAAELERTGALVNRLYTERMKLPGGAGNTNDQAIRKQLNRPPPCAFFLDEDNFFNFDLRKHISRESLENQIAFARDYMARTLTIKEADIFGIPEKLLHALQSSAGPTVPLPYEIIVAARKIPNDYFMKGFITSGIVSKMDFIEDSVLLNNFIAPFRMARFAQKLINSVIHQVKSSSLTLQHFNKPVDPNRPHSSMLNSSIPPKRMRVDPTQTLGNGMKYFAAAELIRKPRYPKQTIYSNPEKYVAIFAKIFLENRGVKVDFEARMKRNKVEAAYAFLHALDFYKDYENKDLSMYSVVTEVPEMSDDIIPEDSFANNLEDCSNILEGLDFDPPVAMQNEVTFVSEIIDKTADKSLEPISQDLFATQEFDDHGDDYGDDEPFFNEVEQPTVEKTEDSLAKLVKNFQAPTIAKPQRRKSDRVQFVEDNAHWEKSTVKKPKKKKTSTREEEDELDDKILFAPREVFSTVTTRRRTTSTSSSSSVVAPPPPPRIVRSQDISLPTDISVPFSFRSDDQLALGLPGFRDADKMFISLPFNDLLNLNPATDGYAMLLRSEYSNLPATAPSRQVSDFLACIRLHTICDEIREARRRQIKERRKTREDHQDIPYSDSASVDLGVDDFDYPMDDIAPHTPEPAGNVSRSGRRSVADEWGHIIGELGMQLNDENYEDEIDEFDFPSKISKINAVTHGEGKYYLKRAIRYVLKHRKYDAEHCPDEYRGIKPPLCDQQEFIQLLSTQGIAASTPLTTPKEGIRNHPVFEDDPFCDPLVVEKPPNEDSDNEEEDDADCDKDTDETVMKPFKVRGFHTLRSLLYHLPEFCHYTTLKILTEAHVFCTLCHMTNENALYLQVDTTFIGNGKTRDVRIMNIDDIREAMNDSEDIDIHMNSD